MGDRNETTPQSMDVTSDEKGLDSSHPPQSDAQPRPDPQIPDADPESQSGESADESSSKPVAPLQKRRRVTRACDECRRKKIKCDGKQPCTHCTVYSYDCTYDQPSNRRRNPAPQYIEALEQRLQKAESILRTVLPGLDLDDPKFDARSVEQLLETTKANPPAKKAKCETKAEDDAQIQSMIDRTGALDLDDSGNWDFHGHSSGYVFMHKFRARFGEQFLPEFKSTPKARSISQVLESPKSAQSSPYDFNLPPPVDLPPREVAIELCRNTLDDCCALMRPIHRPTFFRRLHALYDTEPEHYNNSHVQFLPLAYLVMAVGCLFAKTENATMLTTRGYKEAMEQGYQYFRTAKQMVEVNDCRDLTSLQAVFFMILFLQSTAKLPTCYAYIGIALRGCCRLGLHRNIPNKFNAIEAEERKRLFWLIRKMDSYVGAVLGLPQMLSDDDIDQEYPTEVEDEYITEEGIRPMPPNVFPLLKGTNAHTKLTNTLRKVVRYIYPIKEMPLSQTDQHYSISHRRIRELENDLQSWMDDLPMELRPSENASRDLSRVQQLLRMSYAHVQMMIYRPFIHYVSQSCQAANVDKRSFACAAACISVARNIVHITSEMKKRGLLVGSYWFVMYTTYFAILSLVFFVIENPNSPTGQDILKDALEGRDTLASLAKRSMAADRCSASLANLFDVLPEKLKERRSSLKATPSTSRKRPLSKSVETVQNPQLGTPNSFSATPDNNPHENLTAPARARTFPSDFFAKLAKRNSMPDPANLVPRHFVSGEGTPNPPQQHTQHQPAIANFGGSPVTPSALSAGFDFPSHASNAQIPDLKNVMFPSDNPFAYPNQPISTLESGDGQYSYQESGKEGFSGSGEQSLYSTPNTNGLGGLSQATSVPSGQFDYTFQQLSNDASGGLMQHYGSDVHPGMQFDDSLADMLMDNPLGTPDAAGHFRQMSQLHDPMLMGNLPGEGGGGNMHDESWDRMHKGDMGMGMGVVSGGMRTTSNPGAENGFNASMHDLFCTDSWNGAWDTGYVVNPQS